MQHYCYLVHSLLYLFVCFGQGSFKSSTIAANGGMEKSPISIGCYKEVGTRGLSATRDFKGRASKRNCLEYCRSGDFNLFAVEGSKCMCGKSIAKIGGRLRSEKCREIICPGNKQDWCGGKGAASVFSTHLKTYKLREVGAKRLGCFEDSDGEVGQYERVFSGNDTEMFSTTQNRMDPYTCFTFCTAKNYRYFGLKKRDNCLCGNHSQIQHVVQHECQSECSGDELETCGGANAIELFDTAKDDKGAMEQRMALEEALEAARMTKSKSKRLVPTSQLCLVLALVVHLLWNMSFC